MQICHDCGMRYGNRHGIDIIATYYLGHCDICNQDKIVTEPRDYWISLNDMPTLRSQYVRDNDPEEV